MQFQLSKKYLYAFILVFIIEIIIATFIDNSFIRSYVGDVLVVVLIYCFIKAFIATKFKQFPLCIFIFALLVEIGQYFNLVRLLNLDDYEIARIIIGTTLDLKDIACYLVGCVGLFLFEKLKQRTVDKRNKGKMT
ncbi:Protein of unknown function [Seinonella peptonophila]|uniref:DUF2809 domain-containing protein n=1 Tax=Seinonella peptonophila TaxID=112248 RepID=A0A1M4ZWW9_9BACL|nr:DUF2809 domain-containing protein [Seinonella peptonophila]SHF22327.1 Protein of unknown function [Seinonella peptonophila]